MSASADRDRNHTAESVLRCIDNDTAASLLRHADAGPQDIARRLEELDHEWDTDRLIEVEAAITGLLGLALGSLVKPRFLVLPGAVAAAVLLHAVKGVYPLLPLMRRAGVRTAKEIARERYALKALRGDFSRLAGQPSGAATPAATAPLSAPAAADQPTDKTSTEAFR